MSSIGQGSISIDDSTRIGENAQDTANKVAGNVSDINSDNKLTPTEKLKLKQEYDKDVELYNIDIKQLKSVDLPTAELDSALSNLTNFVTPLFKEMNRTSTVDRNALDSVFTAFATADKNSSQVFVNMVQQVADDAKKAGDDAKKVGEKAQEAGEEAKTSANQAKADATQAKADAATAQQKAQSSIDQLDAHLPDVDEALSTANLVKQNITKLSDTTEQYHNEYTTGIQNVVKTIDDISIGGTNLIENSSSDVVIDDTVKKHGWMQSAIYAELEAGQEYTFTSFVTVNAGKANNICINVFNPNNGTTTLDSNQPIVNGKIEYTFTAVKDFPQLLVYAGVKGGTQGNKVTLHHYQLEKGNKATDWAPAPEDFATATEFDQLSNALRLTAKQADMDKALNSIATFTETADGLQTQVNSKAGQSQVTQLADQYQAVVGSMTGSSLVPNSGYPIDTKHWVAGGAKNIFKTTIHAFYHNSKSNIFNLINEDDKANSECFTSSDRFPVKSNTTYSLSIIAFAGSNMTGMDIFFFGRKYNSTNSVGYDKAIKIINNRKPNASAAEYITATFNTGDCEEGYLRIDNNGSSDGNDSSLYFTEVQVNAGTIAMPWSAPTLSQSDITASIGNIHLGVKNADGSTSTFNMNGNTILMDTAQTIINGNTSIQNGTIDTAKIANAAINTAQIADGAINNAKIANAAIDDAKINSLNGNKIVAGSITANKINVDDLIANGINTKTLTSVNLNTSTLTTPQLDLGLNGTFTEDFDYTQATSMFLPKKNKGTLAFDHGSLQSKGNMQTYVGGKWGGMNDNYTFQAGIDNSQWTEVAPGYIKLDLFKQNDADVGQRTYIDPTGYYYTSRNGIASYLGNVLQTPQVQTSSVLTKYIGTSDGQSLLQIGSNGDHYGLQVGPYAGNEAVLSDFIYNSTTSGAPNVNITANGHLVRSTSASKYKYNIKNPDIETTLGDRLLNVHLATWNDKRAVDLYAEQLSTGEEREKSSIDKYYGLIAEQLRDAGLDMFINYGKNHEIEGIQYDRAWVPLLSVIRRLNNKVNEYELRISKLEGKINE